MVGKSHVISLLAAALALGLLMGGAPALAGEVPRMDVDELKAGLDQADWVIIDVRSSRDWNGSDIKIKGAKRQIPFDAQTWSKDLDKSKTYVLYCA
jgi:hypothetical protein